MVSKSIERAGDNLVYLKLKMFHITFFQAATITPVFSIDLAFPWTAAFDNRRPKSFQNLIGQTYVVGVICPAFIGLWLMYLPRLDGNHMCRNAWENLRV